MSSRYLFALSIVALLMAGAFVVLADHRDTNVEMEPGDSLHVVCNGRFVEHDFSFNPGLWDVECVESGQTMPTPTPTSEATATPTEEPIATPTDESSTFFDAWHGPMAHDGLNVHEHGMEPPAWVVNSELAAVYPEGPEAHQGHKTVCDTNTGVRSCLDVHILATGADTDGDGFSDTGARSVPEHSYQLWVEDPDDGAVYTWDGLIDMSPDGVLPAPLRTSDTGERPIILSVDDGPCETWYSDPGSSVIDIGWTVCGRHTSFDGTVLGGDGTFRGADWILVCNRLPADHPLQNNCVVEFNVARLSFLSTGMDFGSAEPIN